MATKKGKNPISYIYNIYSLLGFLLAAIAATLVVIFVAYETMSGTENPYFGLISYFALPGVVIFGLVMVVGGALWSRHKRRVRGDLEAPLLPRIDLNDPHKRFHAAFFVVVAFGLVIVVAIASIKGIEFTESPAFCGELCHPPMEPEHVAWQNSPHARVKCVECHVGSGIGFYIKAKVNGTKQLYSILTGTYPAPIETPVEGLRPSRDTCEKCHWTDKFYSGRQKIFYHNAPNEQNTPRETNLLIKIGGSPKAPHASGIHWHIGREVTYVPRDRERQDIPYIAVKSDDGSLIEYMDTDKPLTREEIAKGKKRVMDCIDCHNRPTHIYHSPSQEVDENFTSGKLDLSVPYLKKVMTELLSAPYKSEEEATAALGKGIRDYYSKNYPAIASQKADSIKEAVEVAEGIYHRNFFPKMKVAWNTFPNNIGHFYFPGCFRCHDGKHKTAAGKVISKDCNLCHVVMSQKQENIPAGTQVKNFVHPVDIGNEIMNINCSECHLPKPPEGEKKEGHEKTAAHH
jgi:nitrate/TMAO reductase-like tetraheme cytochrome c subunit